MPDYRENASSTYQTFHCRLCGHAAVPQPWGGAECPACDSVSVIDLPTADALARYYAAYVDNYSGGGDSGGSNMLRYARYYARLVERYAPHAGPLEVLDVGTSNNPFPNVMIARGHRVTIVDYTRPKKLADAVRFIQGHLGDAATFAPLAGRFDVVTSWAVLEHVPYPAHAVAQLCDAAQPDGRVIVSSPEHGTLLTRYALGRSGWFFPPEHLHLISPRAMSALFAAQRRPLLGYGRVELSALRWLARYGIGAAEALAGAPVKFLAPARWNEARRNRVHYYKGIDWFAFAAQTGSSAR